MALFTMNQTLFQSDNLSWIMAGLIVFVVANVCAFSKRYMAGDRNYGQHIAGMLLLGVSVLVMVFADHLLVLLAGWVASNLLLVRLMIHKKEWAAARNAGMLALKTFTAGIAMLTAGFWLLADVTGSTSIHTMLLTAHGIPSSQLTLPLLLIGLAALTQSAAWPFHKWLTSSLNSPTPVSALMHAGLVNGGGFLLVRFAPLYLAQPMLLHAIFVAGLLAAVLGTLWKLLQTDIKRMLACSTMGQMGFMVMQCGMGLFPLAVSHLVWHGLFKAYLFLASGSAVLEKRRKDPFGSITLVSFALACIFGLAGAYTFSLAAGNGFTLSDTSGIMLGLAFMASTQIGCNRLEGQLSLAKMLAAFTISIGSGAVYGASVHMMEIMLAPLGLMKPQPLDLTYASGFAMIFLVWLAMNLNITTRMRQSALGKRLYMAALNGSQPHPATITATRNAYQF